MCCGENVIFDFRPIWERFPQFRQTKEINWPILYNRNREHELLIVHSPVGTQSIFENGQCRIIVSGFCTSLEACANFINDANLRNDQEDCEVRHTFGGRSNLRTNLNKIFNAIGLYPRLGIDIPCMEVLTGAAWTPIRIMRIDPRACPILMTQALCCIGTQNGSNADRIMSAVQGEIPEIFREWIDNRLTEWLELIEQKRSADSILLLLGYRTNNNGRRAAIQRLLRTARVRDRRVFSAGGEGQSLEQYLRGIFEDRIGCLIHPANMTDRNLNAYIASTEGQRVRAIIENFCF